MACESCKVVVRGALYKLKLNPVRVELGEAEIKETIGAEKKKELNAIIKKVGLQVVENKGGILIEKIKTAIHAYLNSERPPKLNFSDYLSKELKYDYNYLSTMFSDVESCTISHYLNSVKMERAKEMILFEELTISEIADKLHYSNIAHFSAQFKKSSGLPPSTFKKLKEKRRLTMQEISKKK